jgi:hypothetical protein
LRVHTRCIGSWLVVRQVLAFSERKPCQLLLLLLSIFTLFGRLFLRLISRLWLFCCERKTLFHG